MNLKTPIGVAGAFIINNALCYNNNIMFCILSLVHTLPQSKTKHNQTLIYFILLPSLG